MVRGFCHVIVLFAFLSISALAGETSSSAPGNSSAGGEIPATTSATLLNYTTWKNDNQRTGQQRAESILTPANVNSTHFGMKFSETVDGKIFAQPLYMQGLLMGSTAHNVVFVATEHDSVYAFDADKGGAPLWHKSLIPAGASTVPQLYTKGIIHPEYGITGTPAIDVSAKTIFVVTETLENGAAVFRLQALNVLDGSRRPGSGVIVSASGFQPREQLQRPGLLLANGNVYIAFGSQADIEPYHGWIFAYSATSLAKVAVWNVTATGSEGAIWMGGTGIAADSSGNLYVLTSNGSYNGSTNWSQSFLKLSPNLTVLDHFTPYNWLTLSSADRDVGAGGVLIVPTQSGAFPHELIGCGKPSPIWVINRDKMGGLESSPTSGQAIQEVNNVVGAGAGPQSNDHCFMTPAYWQQNLYFVGNNDVIKAFHLDPVSGKMSTSPTSKGAFLFQFPGAQPVVSSNGSSNGIVWAVSYAATSTGGSVAALHAYNANNLAIELYRSPSFTGGSKYATPTVVNGKVYFGASSKMYVFGLL